MKAALHILNIAILCILAEVFLPAADTSADPSGGAWEGLSHGVAVAVNLEGKSVVACVKNTSKSPIQISGDVRHLVRFFYIDINHTKRPLRDKSEDGEFVVSSKVSGSTIIPGGTDSTFRLRIELSPDELAAIQNFPVFCRFTVYVPASKQYFAIESTPKVLSSGQ